MSQSFLTSQQPRCPQELLAKAKACRAPKVAIARASGALDMEAAYQAWCEGIMQPCFVGEPEAIRAQAESLNWDISQFDLHEAEGEDEAAMLAAKLCGDGHADVLMKGNLHTDAFMKAAISKENGLRTSQRFVHIFHLSPPEGGQPLLVSDAAVNVAPDLKTRQAAIVECDQLLRDLGTKRPKIAILSATESAIPSVPSSMEAKELSTWAAEAVPHADVSGPLALDLILSPQAVATKGLSNDRVAGQADAVIVPDIVSGNVLFKSMVYVGGACAAGLVVGAKVPILLTSRADPPAARLASVALAVIKCSAAQELSC